MWMTLEEHAILLDPCSDDGFDQLVDSIPIVAAFQFEVRLFKFPVFVEDTSEIAFD
jgi:hypothetical protein